MHTYRDVHSPLEARRCWIEANQGVLVETNASSLVLPIANWSGAQRVTLSFFGMAVPGAAPVSSGWAIRASTYCSGLVLFRVLFALLRAACIQGADSRANNDGTPE